MRYVVTGNDENGKSFVAREEEIDPKSRTVLWETMLNGDVIFPIADPDLLDLHIPPGDVRWLLTYKAPGTTANLRWTATIDFDIVLDGQVELLLDSGSVLLNTGDCTFMAGARHAWKTNTEGCLLGVVSLGIKP